MSVTPAFRAAVFLTLQRSFALLALAIAGCETASSDGPESPPDEWLVASEPSVRIGGHDARDGHQLDHVFGATRLSDGRIVVADQGSSELRVFDREGNLEEVLGGPGEGPGEFRHLMELRREQGDTLVVFARLPGLVRFLPGAGYIDQTSVEQTATRGCRSAEMGALLPAGKLVSKFEDNHGRPGCPAMPEGPWRMSALVEMLDPSTDDVDTIGVFPATERNGIYYRVYGATLLVAAAGERLFLGDTREDSIWIFSFDGQNSRALPVPFEPRVVPPEAKRKKEQRSEWSDGSVLVHRYDYPETYPRFGLLKLDTEENLWIAAFPEATEPLSGAYLEAMWLPRPAGLQLDWKVLSAEGAVMADVTTPPDFFPIEIGLDYVLGLERDDLEVESVVEYPLTRTDQGAD